MRPALLLKLLACAALPAAPAVWAESAPEHFRSHVRPLVEKYCSDCHEGSKPKADVDLGQFEEMAMMWRNPKLWEKVAVQLQDRVMPPSRKPQPSEEEREDLLKWVRATLQDPDRSQLVRDPGPSLIRRLTRLEYNRTVQDLLGVDSHPADSFPPDAGGGAGFDNNASTLFLPPLLLERYLAAADAVLAVARTELLFPVPWPEDGVESVNARENLAALSARAFRRPASVQKGERLVNIYESARSRGESREAAFKLAARAILISPEFLFRMESEPEEGADASPVDDYDLASRLSYFLWASMPDAELFQLAEQGKLHEPAVLEQQARRMMLDTRAQTFSENFASQWLRTKELRTTVAPAPDRFPQFTPALREAFYQEPVQFFHALIHDNLPLTDCLDSTYTFANEALAKFYGFPDVEGSEMRRVEVTERARGGILGMGGILALTSYPRRTSPVLRGKWVMEEILGTPPPPPPADVNTQAVERRGEGKSFRQRLEEHRAEPKCAGCHARMDPLGFGLENYDPIGAWRTIAEREPVDSSGQLVNGTKFNGPVELRALLLERKDEFTRNLTEKMLAYALGRGLEPADWWPVQQIVRSVAADDYHAQTLILGVIRSYPFQYRRAAVSRSLVQSP